MRSTLLWIFFFLNIQFAFCQWENLNTGLTDDLTGIVFFGNNGFLSGTKGLYYTTTGGQGAASWKRFEITDNIENANIYESVNFAHCSSSSIPALSTSAMIYACGQTRDTKQAIIMKIEMPSLKYEIVYVGDVNSKLNRIGYSSYNSQFVAVGDDGLMVTINSGGISQKLKLTTDNLNSISFNGNKCKIGANGKILYFAYFDSFKFEEVLTANSENRDVAYGSTNYVLVKTFSVGNKFESYDNQNIRIGSHTNYYGGALNARCISANTDSQYVGTDHGIYYVVGDYALEWQSTSLNYTINSFYSDRNNILYASGNSGVVLRTTNGGGTRVPYVKILDPVLGGCAGNYSQLDALTGAVSSCKWLVNNSQVNTTCAGRLTYVFNTAGTYEIKYTVKNFFGIESTDTKSILITSVPKINLPVIISDNILCKSESIDVQIQNSEKDVVYTLKNENGSKTYGTSEPGNGQTISFKTTLISQSGNYRLQAKNANSNCPADFSDKFYITVEKTQANFHADLINAKPGESTSFYQKAVDAQNYKWDFTPNASQATSNVGQENVSFSKEGETKINLEVWSNNGCYDKIQKVGPFIYNDSENSNNCWALVNDGVDSQWNGYEYEGNYGLTRTEDGFLVSGGFNDQIFDSKIGVKPNFKNKKGSFLTKYDRNGVLKWIVSTEHEPVVRERDKIYSSVVDHDGNIYICGTHEGIFIDNKGDRMKISPIIGSSRNIGYIVKLDKQGRMIWRLNSPINGPLAQKLYIDNDNNLVAPIIMNYAYSDKFPLYFNGVPTTEISQKMVTSQANNLAILKISPEGSVIWYAGITLRQVNGGGISDIGFDKDNNIYVGGNYELDADFYSAGNSAPPQIVKGYPGYGSKLFVVKYNKDGIFQWKVRSNTKDAFFDGASISSLVTDEKGNSYITGSNGCDEAKAIHFFENSDGTITEKSIGTFYLAKINSLGKCEWITGTQYADGTGLKMIRDKDKLHIIGGASDNGTFITTDSQNYNLSISNYDFFLATYDLSGNLKKITANGDNKNHVNVPYMEMFDFFKAEDGSFYLSSNLRGNNYSSFGSVLTTNNIDGTVIHFDEDCGIAKYESTLSTEDFAKTSTVIYPNPTSGKISVDLQNYSGNANVQIYDANGKKISEEKAVDLAKLDLIINGSQGLYFVKITAGENSQTFKVLKQ
ncbi:T9SS type A sorting domain-containing protein [Flavobacterium sp. CF136]|uniref:T9SS type A sorting domain-containing protein n=1 Tax=Flavobacterium sp. (strain CF136) TaxID=1144313 RepID=UPI00027196C9|nr:T9SS type A sorting domain-containing protein [Flavobacterium sp. CF136]EJL62714.1 Por secretion system C-terminal sorting domain-containing protein [Flavobacterium sp. CF136]